MEIEQFKTEKSREAMPKLLSRGECGESIRDFSRVEFLKKGGKPEDKPFVTFVPSL